MPLESATTISELDADSPLPNDPTNQGDDHIRLTKDVLKQQFPGSGGFGFAIPITATEADLNNTSGSTGNLQAQIDALQSQIAANQAATINTIYPVGSLYISTSNTNPATILGVGTWVAHAEGRVMVGVDTGDPDFNTGGEVGGDKDAVVVQHTHTGTTSTAGSHTHRPEPNDGEFVSYDSPAQFILNFGGDLPIRTPESTAPAGDHTHAVSVSSSGESGAGKNLQPYIATYIWRRTA